MITMQLTNKIHSIKDFFLHVFEPENMREKKTKNYTRRMIKKYGKTLRKLSRE